MDGDLLSLKFEGEALRSSSLPIHELAYSLIAVQRIIHKAALFSEGRLDKAVHLPTRQRSELALQITTHEKGSDIWGLAPFLTDPAVGPIFQSLISAAVGAIAVYVGKRVLRREEAGTPSNQKLVTAIFPDMRQLTDRVGNIGDVDRIVLIDHRATEGQDLEIDASVRDYVRGIQFRLVAGPRTIIRGTVTQLLPQSYRLDIKDAPGHYIRVTMDEDLFERVRRLQTLSEREIRFEGIPMYRLGDSFGGPFEFRAERLILPRNGNGV